MHILKELDPSSHYYLPLSDHSNLLHCATDRFADGTPTPMPCHTRKLRGYSMVSQAYCSSLSDIVGTWRT